MEQLSGRRSVDLSGGSGAAGLSLQLRVISEELILALVGIFAIVVMKSFGVGLAPGLWILALVFWATGKHAWQVRTLLLVLCSGSDISTFAYSLLLGTLWVVCGLKNGDLFVLRRDSTLPTLLFAGLYLVWSVASAGVSQARELNLLAFPFWFTTAVSPLAVYLYFSRWKLRGHDWTRVFFFAVGVALAECLVAYVDYIGRVGFLAIWKGWAGPDEVRGTFQTATGFGVFLLEVTTIAIAIFLSAQRTVACFCGLIAGIFLIFIFTADAKTYLAAFGVGWMAALFALSGFRLGRRGGLLAVIALIGIVFLGTRLVELTTKIELIYLRYFMGDLNRKAQYVERAMTPSNRSLADYLMGYGPGTCGSRAANMRAYDTLHKDQGSQGRFISSLLAPHTSAAAENFLVDLYSPGYALTMHERSALLGSPFNSWTAMWFESGLVGLLLFLAMLLVIFRQGRKLYRAGLKAQPASVGAWAAVANVVALAISGLITQALETPLLMIPFWFFVMQMQMQMKGPAPDQEYRPPGESV